MKKIIKVFALITAVAIIALTLGSCRYVDNARAHQAFYTDDTQTEIAFDGHVYKALDPGKLSFVFTDLYTDNINWPYNVTAKDVPALLARMEGQYFDLNADKTIINMWGVNDMKWYIRDDYYDTAKTLIETAKLDHYFFGYYDYPESAEADFKFVPSMQKNVLIDDKLSSIISKTLDMSSDKKVEYTELSKNDDQSFLRLNRCDKDILVTNSDEIYLINDSDKYYLWNGDTFNKKSICPVAEEDISAVKELFKQYPKAAEIDNIYWRFEAHIDDGYKNVATPEKTVI